ncbi:MAG: beta strand repeat-containing protein [Bacteroidia bacterium]
MTIRPGDEILAADVGPPLADRALRAANLSDLLNIPLARQNLGLGTLATQAASGVAITGGSIDGTNIGATTPAYGRFATLDIVGALTLPPTGEFWANDGATVLRVNDRMLVGAAAASDASNPSVDLDWLSALINWPVLNGLAAITSPVGTIAVTAGSQTSQLNPTVAGSTQTTIGVASFGIANNPGTYPTGFFSAYAFYGEGRVYSGTVSNAFGAELNAINLSGVDNDAPTPYHNLTLGAVHGLRLASGGGQGLSPKDAQAALSIVDNEAQFRTGIVFGAGALTGSDGETGFGEAIAFAKGHLLQWYADWNGTGERTAYITSTVTNPDNSASIQAQDGGWLFVQPDGQASFSVRTIADATYGLSAVGAGVGDLPALLAYSNADGDEDVDLGLKAANAGNIVPFATIRPFSAVGIALGLSTTQNVSWFDASGNQAAAIVSSRETDTLLSMQFADTGLFWYSALAGATIFSISEVAASVNYMTVSPAIAGSPPTLAATGPASGVPLGLAAKGAEYIIPFSPIKADAAVTTPLQLRVAQNLLWYNASLNQTAGFTNARTSPNLLSQQFSNTGVNWYSAAAPAGTLFAIAEVASAVNFFTATPAITGSPPILTASGTDSNVGVGLLPKGSYGVTATRLFIVPQANWAATQTANASRTRVQLSAFVPTYTHLTGVQLYPQFSVGGGNQSGVIDTGTAFAYNQFIIDSDNVSAGSGPGGASLLYLGLGVGNSNGSGTGSVSGNRNALDAEIFVNSNVTMPASSFFTGVAGGTTSFAKLGGVPGQARGHVFGSNVWGRARERSGSGARYLNSITGMEIDVLQEANVSALWKSGLVIVEENDSAANADQMNVGLAFVNQPSATTPGWDQVISFGAYIGQFPQSPTGQLIASLPTPIGISTNDAADGVDFTGFNFSRAAFTSIGFFVAGDGDAGGAVFGGTSLQTMSTIKAAVSSVSSIDVLDGGAYNIFPTFSLGAPPISGVTATMLVLTMGAKTFLGVSAGGNAYTAGDVLTAVGGTGTAATVTVETVGTNNAVVNVRVQTAGNYTVLPSGPVSFTGGTGSGFTATLSYKILTVAAGGSGGTVAGTNYNPFLPPLPTKTGLSVATKAARFNVLMAAGSQVPLLLNPGSSTQVDSLTVQASGPTITSGSGAASGTQPKGSIYMRTGGGVGSTIYASQGGGTWNPIPGV